MPQGGAAPTHGTLHTRPRIARTMPSPRPRVNLRTNSAVTACSRRPQACSASWSDRWTTGAAWPALSAARWCDDAAERGAAQRSGRQQTRGHCIQRPPREASRGSSTSSRRKPGGARGRARHIDWCKISGGRSRDESRGGRGRQRSRPRHGRMRCLRRPGQHAMERGAPADRARGACMQAYRVREIARNRKVTPKDRFAGSQGEGPTRGPF